MKLYQGDCVDVLRSLKGDSVDAVVTDPPAGISFMGKNWDGDKGGRDAWVKWLTGVMRESFRVLKPGAHALVWAIPRTSHWTMTALENAGFEIRDVVTHLFGSGFPKSLDVSKAIDKAAGAEREVLGLNPSQAGRKTSNIKSFVNTDETPGSGNVVGQRQSFLTAPATPDAEKWQGFGTALKPAAEFWVLCRKPLGEKTVAANVLKHGTGALNIDGCRIGTDELTPRHNHGGRKDTNVGEFGVNGSDFVAVPSPLGRFPANLVFSHSEGCGETCEPGCAVRVLDEQSGFSKSAPRVYVDGEGGTEQPGGWKTSKRTAHTTGVTGSGGASRFFYCAKASKRDKGADNIHPTVKSTALMSYLIRLVTPPGGIVLDPFMGSGSTGVAALREGFEFIGIEQDASYFGIASGRIGA